jgi:cytochrome c oxidase subunit 2
MEDEMIGRILKCRWVLMLFAVMIAAVVFAPYVIADEGHAPENNDEVIEKKISHNENEHSESKGQGHMEVEEAEHGHAEADEHGHTEDEEHEVAESDGQGHMEVEEAEHGHAEADEHGHTEGEEHEVVESDGHGHTEGEEHEQAGGEGHEAHAHSKESFKEYGLVKAEPGYKEFNIKLDRFKFSPQTIKVDKGDLVKLNLDSTDVEHGFFIDAYGVDFTVPEKGFTTIEFVAEKQGAFRIRCSSTCGAFHPFMIAKLVVGSNYVFWASVMGVVILPAGSLAYATKKKTKKDRKRGRRRVI